MHTPACTFTRNAQNRTHPRTSVHAPARNFALVRRSARTCTHACAWHVRPRVRMLCEEFLTPSPTPPCHPSSPPTHPTHAKPGELSNSLPAHATATTLTLSATANHPQPALLQSRCKKRGEGEVERWRKTMAMRGVEEKCATVREMGAWAWAASDATITARPCAGVRVLSNSQGANSCGKARERLTDWTGHSQTD